MALNLLYVDTLRRVDEFSKNEDAIMKDDRMLNNLLDTEIAHIPEKTYFSKNGMDPSVRDMVTKWMQEVCDEEECEDSVFPLAINFFDRFLEKCNVPKKFLQLVATVCLLMASKIKQAIPISINTLCYYTKHSVTSSQVRSFEVLITSKLEWNLVVTTAYDFIDHILQRITWIRQINILRKHSIALVHHCCSQMEFYNMKPSILSTCCVISSMRGLHMKIEASDFSYICNIAKANEDIIDQQVEKIREILCNQQSNNLHSSKSCTIFHDKSSYYQDEVTLKKVSKISGKSINLNM